MAFQNGFDGDTVALNYILKTLDAKVVAIPGLTCNPNLSLTVNGEEAYYYTRSGLNVSKGKLGEKHDFQKAGNIKHQFSIVDSLNIDSVLPKVNVDTVSADVVNDRVVYETIGRANEYNKLFLEKLYETTSTAVTENSALTKDTVYDDIINGLVQFETDNVGKGMDPTAIIVGPSVYGLLLKCSQFIRSTIAGDEVVYNGKVGSIGGLPVIKAKDLDEKTQKIDYIIMNAEGFAAALNVVSLYVKDATTAGYPGGTLITGEMGYGFDIADKDLIKLRKHA